MKASELFKRYVWLVDTIRRAGHISMHNINSRWVQTTLSDGAPFSRSTFRRQRQEVNERYALRDLPLHSSQKVIAEGADYVDFEVYLRPTSDFLAHILSRGRWLKVISPDDIAQRIKHLLQESLEEYK